MILRLQDLQILNWGCCRSVSPEVSGWRHTSLFDDETGYVTPLKTANNKNILSRIPQLSGASNRNEFFPQTSLLLTPAVLCNPAFTGQNRSMSDSRNAL